MSLCVIVGGKTAVFASSLFTLSWTHSVEKVEWQETWRVLPGGLEAVEAEIRGSGAGMEPPPDARWEDGRWTYVPALGLVPELRLAASGETSGGWHLCADGTCLDIGAEAGEAAIVKPCP